MKFTFIKLVEENKTVNIALMPEKVNGNYTWQINDTDVLEYNTKTKQFSLEVYEYLNDDYELVNTLDHNQAYQIALSNNIIYE